MYKFKANLDQSMKSIWKYKKLNIPPKKKSNLTFFVHLHHIWKKEKKKNYWTYNMISTLAGLIYLSGEISNIVRNMRSLAFEIITQELLIDCRQKRN
jgi:hypothetical protein